MPASNLEQRLQGPLGAAVQRALEATGRRLMSSVADRLGNATQRLTEYTDNGGGPGIVQAVTGGAVKGGVNKIKERLGIRSGPKITNIIESIDVGVPVSLAYNQWTQISELPKFMKKVESVERQEPTKLSWKAQIFWSHRNWESTIVEQVPDERIVWHSEGPKASPDGAISFHEIGPNLTRIILVLEYQPQGFFEHTANIWRAQGRRARLELKHFARQVMTQSILRPDEVEGWRGEIHDGELVSEGEGEPGAREEEEQRPPRREGERRQPEGGQQPARDRERRPPGRGRPSQDRSTRTRSRDEVSS